MFLDAKVIYVYDIPQWVHRFSVSIRQHRIPIGKKKIARNSPRPVYSSRSVPVWQAGQFPRT